MINAWLGEDRARDDLVVAAREEMTARKSFIDEAKGGEISPIVYERWLRAVRRRDLARAVLQDMLKTTVVVTAEGAILIGKNAEAFKLAPKVV